MKTTILNQIKKYYENFYNENVARNPKKVEKIQYFLNWLRKADEKCLTIREEICYMKKCFLELKIEYFFRLGSDGYSAYHYTNGSSVCYFTTSKDLPNFYGDVYYSEQASTNAYPANLDKIAQKRGSKALRELDKDDTGAIFSKAKVIEVEFEAPYQELIYHCKLTYPHPIANKDGSYNREFTFIFYDDEIFMGEEGGPLTESGKRTSKKKTKQGGCYVATCVYGSYDCPQVWTLRRYRDNTLSQTWYGRAFIRMYYAISPTLVKWFGKTKWFKKFWQNKLDKMVNKLQNNGFESTPYDDII